MKFIIILVLSLLVINLTKGQSSNTIYYSEVEMPDNLTSTYWGLFDTKLLAEDLAQLLAKASGKSFIIKPFDINATKGIFLILDVNGNYLNNENGKLESNGKDYLKIKAKYTTGVSYAMYSWLEELGFHFYLPGDEWTIFPVITSPYNTQITTKSYKPYFKLRLFGGSGGVYKIKGLDENRQNEKDWLLWGRRNRMGSDFMNIDGHVGEDFNIIHKQILEKDPSILAPYNGKRQYAIDAKLDPTNKKGVALFSNWVVEQSRATKKKHPSFLPYKKYYSADAGDGLNYCYTEACLKQYKSVSNQVFGIVNETAKKIKIDDPLEGISTLAYTDRADTPSIKIESNVHVQVVSSAYQSVSTKAGLMLRWAAKTKNLSQYDYLNIGVWLADHPYFDLAQYHNYLQFVKSLDIQGMCFETSRSKFASGILQYFIIQYLCNPYQSIDIKMDEFCSTNFGKAASPIKKLLKEWYFSSIHIETNFDMPTFYPDELGRFIQYIEDAENTLGLTNAELYRINELKVYVVFLCKMYELRTDYTTQKNIVSNPLLKTETGNDVLSFTWQFYKSKIFHNTELTNILLINKNDDTKAMWSYDSDNYKKFNNSNPKLLTEVEFKKMSTKYSPLISPLLNITDSFLKATVKYSADSFKISSMDESLLSNFIYPFEFYCASPGILKISYSTATAQKPSLQNGKIALIAVEKNDYSYMKYSEVFKENSSGTLTFNLPAAGKYKLYLSRFDATHVDYIIFPGNNLFYHNKKSILTDMMQMQINSNYPNKQIAVYVQNITDIKYRFLYWDCTNTNSFFTSTGTPLKVNIQNQPSEIKVPLIKEQQNNFIFYSNTQYRWPPILINTAPYYFFLNFPLKK